MVFSHKGGVLSDDVQRLLGIQILTEGENDILPLSFWIVFSDFLLQQ
jgi:hypothetical protein